MYQLYKKVKGNIYILEEQRNLDDFDISNEEEILQNFPEYNKEEYVVTNEPMNLAFPILDKDSGKLREMTRQEMVANGVALVLGDGEYLENGEVKSVEKPKGLIRPIWNVETNTWEESITKEELITERKNKILKYAELKKEIETLTKFSDEFESDLTITILQQQMEDLKKEINHLLQKIKKIQ